MKPSSTMISVCLCIGVMLATGAVYQPVLTAGFANETDNYYLYESGRSWSQSVSWQDVCSAFKLDKVHRPSGTGGYYQPITALSFQLDDYLSRPDGWLTQRTLTGGRANPINAWFSRAFQFHLTNLLLHIANTALVFMLVRKLTKSHVWPVLLSCFFALHPAQVESVAWISQRMTLLGGFFSLLSLACFLQSHDSKRSMMWMIPTTVAFAAAILCRPLFAVLPVVMLVLDVWPLGRKGFRPLVEKIPLLMVMVFSALIQSSAWRGSSLAKSTSAADVELVSHTLASLFARLFWPLSLTPYNPESTTVAAMALGPWFDLAILALLVGAMILAFRISKPLFAALAGVVLLILPALVDVPFAPFLLSDQYLYAAWIVPILVFAAWISRTKLLLRQARGRWTAIGMTAVLAIFAVHSYAQTWVWQSSRDLFEQTTRLYPKWMHAHIGLIESLIQENEFDLALAAANRAARENPDHPSVDFYVGTILLLSNDSRAADALPPLKRALASNPNWIECLQNIGVALARSGRSDEAIAYLERARDLQPRSSGIRLGLGNAYLKIQRFASARREFQEALRHNNDPMAHLGLAIAWAANDEPRFALRHLEAAIAKDPRFAERAGRSPELRKLIEYPGFESLIRIPLDPVLSDGGATESPAARRATGL